MKQKELISAALNGEATLVIKNANVVNVFTNEIIKADVAVCEDMIIGIGEYSCDNEIDAKGAYLSPGFIDSHVHIESSMVIPSSFAQVILPLGTTTIIADPHEMANVCGTAGIRAMYKLTDELPLRVLFMMPSCVPATPFENSGAELHAEDMEQFMRKSRMLGLGEVMDYVSTVSGDPVMLDKLRLFDGRPIDGHAPLLSGRALSAYRVAGPSTDHECSNFAEVLEKMRSGMSILIRIGSAANDMADILENIAKQKLPTENVMFCTDDKHIETIRSEGHINNIAALAVKSGIAPIDAIKMASYNSARAYGLKKLGAIAPGYRADMILLEDLENFKVKATFTAGRLYKSEPIPFPLLPADVFSSVHIANIKKEDLKLRLSGNEAPVIKVTPHQLVTTRVTRNIKRDNDGCFVPEGNLSKLCVIERHHALKSIGVGIVEGLNIKCGAIASTVAHDSHNIVVVGDNDEDILAAVNSLKECGGGYCVVNNGVVLARLPLPIAGLITDAPIENVLDLQRALLDAAHSLGCPEDVEPLITLSFLALPVIPEIRLTDKGLFDVVNSRFIDFKQGGLL